MYADSRTQASLDSKLSLQSCPNLFSVLPCTVHICCNPFYAHLLPSDKPSSNPTSTPALPASPSTPANSCTHSQHWFMSFHLSFYIDTNRSLLKINAIIGYIVLYSSFFSYVLSFHITSGCSRSFFSIHDLYYSAVYISLIHLSPLFFSRVICQHFIILTLLATLLTEVLLF